MTRQTGDIIRLVIPAIVPESRATLEATDKAIRQLEECLKYDKN